MSEKNDSTIKRFVTETRHDGPVIYARSFEDAEKIAHYINKGPGLFVTGYTDELTED